MVRVKVKPLAISSFIFHFDVKRPIDWAEQFGNAHPLDVEIGFGLGDFLIPMAQANRERNFVGLELDWARVKKTLQKIQALSNIRILQVDATVALSRLFEPQRISRIYGLFPCPWPKKKHIRHRLFSHDFLRLLNSRLCDGGEVQIITDHPVYFNWVREEANGTGFVQKQRKTSPRFNTKYERKWSSAGQKEFYELSLVKNEHCVIPLEEDVPLQAYFVKKFDPQRFSLENLMNGGTAVIFKDFLYDEKQRSGMVHILVAEENITQHVWVAIRHTEFGWCIAKAEGQTALPTRGVSLALRHIHHCVQKTVD